MKRYPLAAILPAALILALAGCPVEPEDTKPRGSFNTGLLGQWIAGDAQKRIEIRGDTGFAAEIMYSGFTIPVTGKLEFVSGNNYTLQDPATTNTAFAPLVRSFKGVIASLVLAEDKSSFVFSAAGTEPEAKDADNFFGGTYRMDESGSYINPDLVGVWSGPAGAVVTVNSYTINADCTFTANAATPLGPVTVTGRFAHNGGDRYRIKDLNADNGAVAAMMGGLNNAPVTLTVADDKRSFVFASQNATIQTYYGGVYTVFAASLTPLFLL
jgi:hypothetical protein